MTNQCIIDFIRTQHIDYKCVSDFVNPESGEEKFDFVSGSSSEANFRVENSEMHRKIRKALRNLKPQYKKIALLYFVQDLKYEEIAEICNVPIGTVKGMISRCREQLESELKGLYFCRRKQYEITEEI
jgi:RNA polymerase sigma factor (sigma-70 family)